MRRRLRRIGSIRILPSGRAEVRVRGRTADGVPFTLQRVVARDHAEQILSEFRKQAREYKDGLARPATRTTLEEYCQGFRKNYAWSSERNSTWLLLKPLWKLHLAAIDDSAVSTWANAVLWTGRGRAPRGSGKASKSYILHAYELLRRLLRQAVTDRLLPVLALSARPIGIPSQKQARKKRRPFSLEELAAILTAARAKDPELFLRFDIMATTGVRPCELIDAKIADVWDAAPFCEGAPEGSAVIHFPPTKEGHEHLSPIRPELAKRLRAHIDSLPPEARGIGVIFPIRGPDGAYRKRKKYISNATWREVFRSAGIPDSEVLYQLRHTRATEWANRTDVGARRAADLLGHADMRTTEGYAARARGLVPAAFESPLTRIPPPEPENTTPGPGRKNKRSKGDSEKHAPTEGMPNPRKKSCPQNARNRLEALAVEVENRGAARIAGRLTVELGPECSRFVEELAAELADIDDSGLTARLAPLCDAVRECRPAYLRLVSAPREGVNGAPEVPESKVGTWEKQR
jgi:integrase